MKEVILTGSFLQATPRLPLFTNKWGKGSGFQVSSTTILGHREFRDSFAYHVLIR
jgi:hypothetical protein